MSEKIVQLNEEAIKGQLKEMIRGSVEETLNELLEQEAEKLTQATRYERNEARIPFQILCKPPMRCRIETATLEVGSIIKVGVTK